MRHKSIFYLASLVLFVLLSAAKCSHNKQERTEERDAINLFERGLEVHKAGNYEAALSYYTQSIAKDSTQYVTFLNRGYVKEILKDTLGAIQDYVIANRLNNTNPIPLNNIGAVYYERHQPEIAEKYFLEAIRVDSLESDPYYSLGLIAYDRCQFQKAISFFKRFIELKDIVSKRLSTGDLYNELMPEYEVYHTLSLYYIGLSYKNLNQIDSAIYYLKQALSGGISEAADSLNLIHENKR